MIKIRNASWTIYRRSVISLTEWKKKTWNNVLHREIVSEDFSNSVPNEDIFAPLGADFLTHASWASCACGRWQLELSFIRRKIVAQKRREKSKLPSLLCDGNAWTMLTDTKICLSSFSRIKCFVYLMLSIRRFHVLCTCEKCPSGHFCRWRGYGLTRRPS